MKTKVYTTKSKVQLMGIKNLLDSEGIECLELDNSDSSYAGLFGHYELLVKESDEEKAKELISQFQSEN
ncbi:putative signal transducing protein [Psychroflexus lacisalsi]|jgi:hypothetical protein|uniref:DUF2007 domain-containing protein n=1 Tax=Psychroflexus lacisalsi TaxID=503928 RepID=A0ABN1K4R5_9FLAO|nr:DUF2007 domain-containing protein [Psychroflexus lacisalsi]MBZ9619002.1 DUF2007 domain-containing protein [Psychroflexus lacisalsi]